VTLQPASAETFRLDATDFEACGLSHPGIVREANEDAWHVDPVLGLALAADGVGGHSEGAWASRAAARLVSGFVARAFAGAPGEHFHAPAVQERVIRRAIGFAHQRMISGREPEDLSYRRGSTIVGIWAPAGTGAEATIFHVGDSRLYLLRQGKLLQLTRDHSAYEQWLAYGAVGEPPSKKYILQALGLSDHVDPEVRSIVLMPDDRALLCTDGLTGAVEDSAISAILSSADELSRICERLIALGLAHAAQDNLTAVTCGFRRARSE
jgi:protein phosphatase